MKMKVLAVQRPCNMCEVLLKNKTQITTDRK